MKLTRPFVMSKNGPAVGVLTEIDVQASMKSNLGIDVPAHRMLRVCAALA